MSWIDREVIHELQKRIDRLEAEQERERRDHRASLERLQAERDRLRRELAAERRQVLALAGRLDRMHDERHVEAVRRWREASNLAEELRQIRQRVEQAEQQLAAARRWPWWRWRR